MLKAIRLLSVGLIALLLSAGALAQPGGENTVTFNDISLTYAVELGTTITVRQVPGDDPSEFFPGGPVAAHTLFSIYDELETPFVEFGPLVVRVFRVDDLAGYSDQQAELDRLRGLLAQATPLESFVNADMSMDAALPYLLPANASQILRAQPEYVNTPDLVGIRYLTVYGQDASPITSDRVRYVFVGFNANGYAVHIDANLPIQGLPEIIPDDFDWDTFYEGDNLLRSYEEAVAIISAEQPARLALLDALVQSLRLGTSAGVAVPPVAVVTPEPPVAVAPPAAAVPGSFGGLGGYEWSLVSYGALDAPVGLIEGTQIVLTFGDNGVGGSAGCNTYRGVFAFAAGSLTISDLATTRIACEEDVMAQEMAYLTALSRATRYVIDGATLTIFYREPADEIEGGEASEGAPELALVFTRD